MDGSEALEGAVVELESDAVIQRPDHIGQVEGIHVLLSDLAPDGGQGSVERRYRIGELVVEAPHLRVDLPFDDAVHVAQDHRFHAVEDERSQRVDGPLHHHQSAHKHKVSEQAGHMVYKFIQLKRATKNDVAGRILHQYI